MDLNLPPCCFPSIGASLAEKLYASYNSAGAHAGLNYRGEPCPVWADLPADVRAKWEAVAAYATGWLRMDALLTKEQAPAMVVGVDPAEVPARATVTLEIPAPSIPELVTVEDPEAMALANEVPSELPGEYVPEGASTGMSFSWALIQMKYGLKVRRTGWNGKGMWVCLGKGQTSLPAEKFWNVHTRAFAEANGGFADVLPYIIMKTADNKVLMGWLASQTDMLAEDWDLAE